MSDTTTPQPPVEHIQPSTGEPIKVGDKIANPAEPAAPTAMPASPVEMNRSLVNEAYVGAGYPKKLYHPVHGAVPIDSPNAEASLSPRTDYFDTPEEADMHRTATEAWTTHAANLTAKLQAHDQAGHYVVRNSVQSDEKVQSGSPEPL